MEMAYKKMLLQRRAIKKKGASATKKRGAPAKETNKRKRGGFCER